MKTPLALAALILFPALRAFAADPAPSGAFELSHWKLQIPGPKEVKSLKGYSSDYFHLSAGNEMCFHLDAAEKGTTKTAHYVRSELRHLAEWTAGGTHTLSAEFRVESRLNPDKVTALQIHGITGDGGDAPPLLRVAVNRGDLVAMIKTADDGVNTDSVILKKALGAKWVKVDVTVKNGHLTVTVDGAVKLSRSLAFWTFANYFKAGCYPQATQGTVDVLFRKLKAE